MIAQRELVASLQSALDARRQRIIVSGSRINAGRPLEGPAKRRAKRSARTAL